MTGGASENSVDDDAGAGGAGGGSCSVEDGDAKGDEHDGLHAGGDLEAAFLTQRSL